jgi:hypothetical protein
MFLLFNEACLLLRAFVVEVEFVLLVLLLFVVVVLVAAVTFDLALLDWLARDLC